MLVLVVIWLLLVESTSYKSILSIFNLIYPLIKAFSISINLKSFVNFHSSSKFSKLHYLLNKAFIIFAVFSSYLIYDSILIDGNKPLPTIQIRSGSKWATWIIKNYFSSPGNPGIIEILTLILYPPASYPN